MEPTGGRYVQHICENSNEELKRQTETPTMKFEAESRAKLAMQKQIHESAESAQRDIKRKLESATREIERLKAAGGSEQIKAAKQEAKKYEDFWKNSTEAIENERRSDKDKSRTRRFAENQRILDAQAHRDQTEAAKAS